MSDAIYIVIEDDEPLEVIEFAEKGDPGTPGSSASVTNTNVNAAISSNPSATRTALALGTAATTSADDYQPAGNYVQEGDPRLVDARQPLPHDHYASDIVDFATQAADAAPVKSVNGQAGDVVIDQASIGLDQVDNTNDASKPVSVATQAALDEKVGLTDSRLSNAREWTASTVTQAEAEAGVATTRRAWTAERVRQAVVAWWNTFSVGFRNFASNPTSANLAAAVTDGTGTESLVFANGPTISNPTIDNGSVSSPINNDSYSLTPLALQATIHARSLVQTSPPVSFFHDFDVVAPFTVIGLGATGTGLADDSLFGPLAYGQQRIGTGATADSVRGMFARISGSLGSQTGMRFRACFAIENPADCEVMMGLGWVHQHVWGLAYRSGQDGGVFTFVQNQFFVLDSGIYTPLANSITPQAGNFNSGKRYIVDITSLTASTVRVIIMEADFNLNNWTVLNDSVVTTPQAYLSTGRHGPCARVTTKTNAVRNLWFDWMATEHLTAER